MKINGYKIREALKRWEIRKEAAEASFPKSLHKFEGDTKGTPDEEMTAFLVAEDAISRLQVAQMAYNLNVQVHVDHPKVKKTTMSLAEAIKTIGGLSRAEKMWKTAAGDTRRSLYSDDTVRQDGEVRALPVLDKKTILQNQIRSSEVTGAYRAAIATSNAREIEIESLTAELFE